MVEHEVLVAEVRADEDPLFEHPLPMASQDGDRCAVECDRAPAAGCLRLADRHRAADLGDGLNDPNAAGVEGDISPAKADGFPPPHAGGGQQDPQRVKAVAGLTRLLEEGPERRGVPHMDTV